MTNPVVDLIGDRTGRIVPVYPQSEKAGVMSWDVARFVDEVLARAGIKLQLVPYAGGTAQGMNDVLSGRVPLILDAYAGLAAALKGNLIKGLADTSLERLPGFEELPTVAETVPGFFVGAWTILVAPVGTPDAIVRKVNADLWTALNDPGVKTKFQANGAFIRAMTPEQVTAFVQGEQTTWRPILEQVARQNQQNQK